MSDMKELRNSVNRLIMEEHIRANKNNNPVFASNHEAYAVIIEELDETVDEVEELNAVARVLWDWVKCDAESEVIECLDSARKYALLTACEAIQTSAMCQKALDSILQRKKNKPSITKVFEEDLEVFD